jgi:hypothetical protein
MAMVDVLSKGRLECGFVRGVPYEVLDDKCPVAAKYGGALLRVKRACFAEVK